MKIAFSCTYLYHCFLAHYVYLGKKQWNGVYIENPSYWFVLSKTIDLPIWNASPKRINFI